MRQKHRGYSYDNYKIVVAASGNGLKLEHVEHMGFETEPARSYVCRHALKHVPLVREDLIVLGRQMPYVRMFTFSRQ